MPCSRWSTLSCDLIVYLQAVTDWGNALSSEASALTQYNSQLATLERLTGTILETHGVVFCEERFGAVGPLGHLCEDKCYPLDMRPSQNADRYPVSDRPAEDAFDLQPPSSLRDRLRNLPYEDIKLPSLEDSSPPTPKKDDPAPELNPKRPKLTPPLPDPSKSGATQPATERTVVQRAKTWLSRRTSSE